jgi:hypothetical protein
MDVERAKALKATYWDEIVEEIEERIGKVSNQLRFTSPEKLPLLQEKIRVLEECKGIPDSIIDQSPDTI